MDFMEYITGNALILIPALNLIGMFLKNSGKVSASYIPFILLFLGIGGAIALMGISGQSVIQGVLVTGAAVYGHQLVKQYKMLPSSPADKPAQADTEDTSADAPSDEPK